MGKAWVTCPLLKRKEEASPMHIRALALGAGAVDTEWAKRRSVPTRGRSQKRRTKRSMQAELGP